jgi:hypothetical protein
VPVRWIRKAPWTVALVIVALFLNGYGCFRWQRKRNPAHALEQAGEAVRRHDASLFDNWVDVDKLAGSYYDQHLLPMRLRENAIDENRRKRDVAAIARRLRRWVVTTRIDEDETPRLTLLGEALRRSIEQERTVVGKLSSGGRTVIASVAISDDSGRKAVLDIRLDRQRGGTWRITEVTNVQAVIDDLRTSEQRRVQAIDVRLARAVTIGQPRLLAEQSAHERVTRLYTVSFTPAAPGRVTWSATCDSAAGSGSTSGQVLEFKTMAPQTVSIRCQCRTVACGAPAVRVDAIHRVDGTLVLQRAVPLPLD